MLYSPRVVDTQMDTGFSPADTGQEVPWCHDLDVRRAAVGEEPDLAHAIRRVGNKPFVYSSDYPHEVNNEYCKHEISEFLENQEIGAADKAAFLHGNARRFYSLGAAGL